MTEERKYIYSIIKNPQETLGFNAFRLAEVPKEISLLPTGQAVCGINNRDIILIPYRDLAAAVSNIQLINFNRLNKKERSQLIAAHDQVNVGLMKDYNVIPLRFGMIAENTEEIRDILAKAYLQFRAALERIAGKAEFIVEVFWDKQKLLEKIAQADIEIQKMQKEVKTKGRILGLASKMKLGKRLFEATLARRKEYVKNILHDLATHFPNFSAGKLLEANKEGATNEVNSAQGGSASGGKEMIMNYSFLIGKTEESALEFQLNKLAEKYTNELKFKYIGPMAPYSFAAINLSVGNFDLVDNARKTLGLEESAALSEIKQAYHKLAGQFHPDKQALTMNQLGLGEAEKKMKDIITANEILTVYCQHYLSALPSNAEPVCSFRKEAVEKSIIVYEK
ncbi:MAG: GvpL/GvpF family gas vesicle protein [Candidatus Falkowbacteria bacterium]